METSDAGNSPEKGEANTSEDNLPSAVPSATEQGDSMRFQRFIDYVARVERIRKKPAGDSVTSPWSIHKHKALQPLGSDHQLFNKNTQGSAPKSSLPQPMSGKRGKNTARAADETEKNQYERDRKRFIPSLDLKEPFYSETLVPGNLNPELVSEEINEVGMRGMSQTQTEASSVPEVEDPNLERNTDEGVLLAREFMFSKVLTPSDVGKVNGLVVPTDYAKKYFFDHQIFNKKKGLVLDVEDPAGKLWKFRYSHCQSNQPYVLTRGWSRFVEDKKLVAGDTIYFHRGVGKEGMEKPVFITWSHRADSIPSPSLSVVSGSLQDPFDAMIVVNALSYCALFPPDYEFEKETLVQLWMAEGIFVHEPMEKLAGFCFEYCVSKCYFLFCRNNLVTGSAMYKFIGDNRLDSLLIPRLSNIVRIDSSSNLNDLSPEVSHVVISCHNLKDSTASNVLKKFEQLRTLIFFQAYELSFKQVSRDFFLSLGVLRVLDLSQAPLLELPSSIGKLICLCYLDLSGTPIKRLPEAIDSLQSLQTLKLRGCSNLSTLPKGMRKLVNLRHLDFDVLGQLRSMPQGIGALNNIRTLSAFLVGVDEGCSIRQLKNMNNLSGSFCISRLENVLTKGEAEEACLSDKSQLTRLELCWSDTQHKDVVGNGKVLSSLQPNTSLNELQITCYGGFELPSWICDPAFSKLVSITLFECENCLALSSLGQLPSLKFLNIIGFHQLKVINHNFYGDVGSSGCIGFPMLKNLTVDNMSSLEEWLGDGSFYFPCLKKLTVKHCPSLYRLFSLSCLISLESLEISHCGVLALCSDWKLPAGVETFIIQDCPLISASFLNDESQERLEVAHIPHVWIDHQEISFGQRDDVDIMRP